MPPWKLNVCRLQVHVKYTQFTYWRLMEASGGSFFISRRETKHEALFLLTLNLVFVCDPWYRFSKLSLRLRMKPHSSWQCEEEKKIMHWSLRISLSHWIEQIITIVLSFMFQSFWVRSLFTWSPDHPYIGKGPPGDQPVLLLFMSPPGATLKNLRNKYFQEMKLETSKIPQTFFL